MRAEGFGVTATEAKDVGIHSVMEAESAERKGGGHGQHLGNAYF